MTKKRKTLNGPFWTLNLGFCSFGLFRISIFGFRICRMSRLIRLAAWMLLVAFAGLANAAGSWQEDWERSLQAAKKEGTLAMIGPPGADRRDALTETFQKKYGSALSTTPIPAPAFYPGSAPSVRRIAICGMSSSPALQRVWRR